MGTKALSITLDPCGPCLFFSGSHQAVRALKKMKQFFCPAKMKNWANLALAVRFSLAFVEGEKNNRLWVKKGAQLFIHIFYCVFLTPRVCQFNMLGTNNKKKISKRKRSSAVRVKVAVPHAVRTWYSFTYISTHNYPSYLRTILGSNGRSLPFYQAWTKFCSERCCNGEEDEALWGVSYLLHREQYHTQTEQHIWPYAMPGTPVLSLLHRGVATFVALSFQSSQSVANSPTLESCQ